MYDVIIIGCGVVGAATAYQLAKYRLRTLVLEAQNDVANGTTKANSAIIHAGYDPEPGTKMALHLGVPVEDIAELAEHSANTVPVMMPYIDAFFMPRAKGDRPDIVPKDAVNFAFLGQFAETGRDTIFTTEYSMRTGMEAVYRLLNIDRGVPEVWGSTYDVRALVDASVKLRDGRKLTDMELPLMGRIALKEALKKLEGTDLEKFLRQYNAI